MEFYIPMIVVHYLLNIERPATMGVNIEFTLRTIINSLVDQGQQELHWRREQLKLVKLFIFKHAYLLFFTGDIKINTLMANLTPGR